MNIVILTSSSGGGHVRAGANLARAFGEIAPDISVTNVDSYDFIHPFKKWQYTRGWEVATRYLPALYRPLRNWVVTSPGAVRRLQRGFVPAATAFGRWASTHGPIDVIIATHPHAAGVAALYKGQHKGQPDQTVSPYLAQAFTDFQFHAFYATARVDRFFTPAQPFADLLHRELPKAAVSVMGMPIDPCFTVPIDETAVRNSFGIADDGRPVVVISRGSFGWGGDRTRKLLKLFVRYQWPVHVVAVAGTNQTLQQQMQRVAAGHPSIHVVGWIENMYQLLGIASLFAGKPGGMQVAECLARGVPMLLFDPIPGQEDANIQFVERQQVGVFAQDMQTTEQLLQSWLGTSSGAVQLQRMAERSMSLGHPDGAYRIANQVLDDCNYHGSRSDPQKRGQSC